MRLDRALLILNLLLILVSVAAHQIGAEEFSFLIVTVIVCAVVWRRTTTGRPLHLNDTLATLTCLTAFIVLMYRGLLPVAKVGFSMFDVGVAPVGDFLIVFQWVYLCREKKGRDYFWVYLVTLVHMGTAGLLMPGVGYGFFFSMYAVVAVCALSVQHLASEAGGSSSPAEAAELRRAGAGPPAKDLRAGAGFFLRYIPLTLVLLVPVAVLFVLLPRRAGESVIGGRFVRVATQPVAGFSPTVRLGEMGTIQSNPQRVMHVTVRDPVTQAPIEAAPILLRGIALETYRHEEKGWVWQSYRWPRPTWWKYATEESAELERIYTRSFPAFAAPPFHKLICEITLEPLDTTLLFAPFAPESVTSQRWLHFYANMQSHVLQRSDLQRRASLTYTVVSRIFDPGPPPRPGLPQLPERALAPYLDLPEDLSPQIQTLARQIAPLSLTDSQKAERILNYLSDSRRFSYTLVMTPTEGVEPVEDFLFNLKQGHCEYFASAMAVLLREANVPSRVVNGFKVFEWNPIAESYVVRQQHAHSWVEAYVRPYGWRTFDPSVQRDSATPQPMFARRLGRILSDWTEMLWVSHVLNYDTLDQARIYGGVSIGSMLSWWARFSTSVRGMENALPSAQGYFMGILTALVVLLCGVLVLILGRELIRTPRRRRARTEIQFYNRMERLLVRRGFQRADSQTPWEFHARLAARGWPAMNEVAFVTEKFCSARYAGRAPTAEELREIDAALGRLWAVPVKR